MSCDDESGNSLPFIDDDDDDGGGVDDVNDDVDTVDDFQYKLNIIEKYKNKNRNIEIKNQSFSNEFINNPPPPPPIAPLAYENDLSDDKTDDNNNNDNKSSVGNSRDSTILKLVVRGWNSTISIQGLDKKSNISFNRKIVQGKKQQTTTKPKMTTKPTMSATKGKNVENVQTNNSIKDSTKKKKWKMLTKSIISKSKKFDKKSDERYPKYVLLKNEEEEEEKVRDEVETDDVSDGISEVRRVCIFSVTANVFVKTTIQSPFCFLYLFQDQYSYESEADEEESVIIEPDYGLLANCELSAKGWILKSKYTIHHPSIHSHTLR